MDRTATEEAFFTRSGSSPPAELPDELIEELAALLASALVADIRKFPNLAEIQANHHRTVESPRGHDRRVKQRPAS